MSEEEQTKEEFCGACVAVPVAFLGAGATKGIGGKGMRDKKRRGINLCISIIAMIVSVGLAYYFLKVKECKECR